MKASTATWQTGDVVVVSGHRVGEPERVGEILEVVGDETHPRYRVRWDDGHESNFYPGSDAVIRRSTSPRPRKAGRARAGRS